MPYSRKLYAKRIKLSLSKPKTKWFFFLLKSISDKNYSFLQSSWNFQEVFIMEKTILIYFSRAVLMIYKKINLSSHFFHKITSYDFCFKSEISGFLSSWISAKIVNGYWNMILEALKKCRKSRKNLHNEKNLNLFFRIFSIGDASKVILQYDSPNIYYFLLFSIHFNHY